MRIFKLCTVKSTNYLLLNIYNNFRKLCSLFQFFTVFIFCFFFYSPQNTHYTLYIIYIDIQINGKIQQKINVVSSAPSCPHRTRQRKPCRSVATSQSADRGQRRNRAHTAQFSCRGQRWQWPPKPQKNEILFEIGMKNITNLIALILWNLLFIIFLLVG